MIKLVASDIDGTLIPIGGQMSQRTKSAIAALVEKGVISGRTFSGAVRPFTDMGFDCPVISANGGRADAHTYESPIFEDTIERETSVWVCEKLIGAGCFMTSYVGTRVYTLPETNGFGSRCVSVSEASGEVSGQIEQARREMRENGTVAPYKYEAYSDDAALLERLKTEFLSKGLSVAGAFTFNLEIMAPGAGKGRALQSLMKRYGISKHEVLALGDGANDISLLNAAGLPVAMGDGVDSVKRAARIIAPRADEDGAAQILEQYVLSEKTI